MRVRTEAKVLDCLTGVLGSTEQESVGSSRCTHGQLVNGKALAAGLDDARAGGRGEAKCGNGELGDLQNAVVIGHSSNQNDRLSLVCLSGVLVRGGRNQAGKRHWWAVDFAHHQSAQDGLVELGVGAAGEESVELDEEGEVGVGRLLDPAMAALDMVKVCIPLSSAFCVTRGLHIMVVCMCVGERLRQCLDRLHQGMQEHDKKILLCHT